MAFLLVTGLLASLTAFPQREQFLTLHLGMPGTKILTKDATKVRTASEEYRCRTHGQQPEIRAWRPQSHAAHHTSTMDTSEPRCLTHVQENRTSPSHCCPEIAESRSFRKNTHSQNSQLFPHHLPVSQHGNNSVMKLSEKTLSLQEVKCRHMPQQHVSR